MDVSINGPKILFTLPFFGGIDVSQSVVSSWVVIALVTVICLWLTHGMSVTNPGKRQIAAEKLVLMARSLVENNMGRNWQYFAPLVATILAYSFFSSALSITGLRSPTADFSVTLAMALVTFTLIQVYHMKPKGPVGFVKRFFEPVPVMLPMNIISEVALPASMSLRHFGNITSGTVITALVYGALASLSKLLLGWIPNTFLANIPIFQVGIPAVLSVYFDVFSSGIQAYIFCMLTMANIASAAEE